MFVTTADLLARPLADRIADLRTQERRFPLTVEERASGPVQALLLRGEARVFMDGREMWLEPTDAQPVHAATVQLWRRKRGTDTTVKHGQPVTAPAAVRAIQGSWRDESESVVSATVGGVFVTISELREQVREEQYAARARS